MYNNKNNNKRNVIDKSLHRFSDPLKAKFILVGVAI